MNRRFTRTPYILFLPFLFYYVYYIVKDKWPTLYGDEIRYVNFARNLLHGFYSPPAPHINLWNGPGYPLVLVPFIALNIPALYITLMNALYQYFAVVLLYKALKLVSTHQIALICGLLLAVYPNALSVLPILYTEAFTSLLISSFIYSATLFYIKKENKYSITAGLVLGFLTLTKIIFGYVLILCLAICLITLLFKKRRAYYLRSVYVLLIGFGVSVPYLIYTFSVTGKVFYWGDSGGMSLYWMSTPYEHEYGDWKLPNLSNKQYPTLFKSAEGDAILKKNHSKEIDFIMKHNEMEQDELFKKRAISNIEHNPMKFIRNYYYNFSRMLFNFPYSYAYQDAAIVGNILIGSSIFWASLAGIVLTWINRRKIIFPVKLLLLITGVYLLLSGALSSYPRQLDVMVPVFFYWIGYLIANIKSLSPKFEDKENLDDINLSELAGIGVYRVKDGSA